MKKMIKVLSLVGLVSLSACGASLSAQNQTEEDPALTRSTPASTAPGGELPSPENPVVLGQPATASPAPQAIAAQPPQMPPTPVVAPQTVAQPPQVSVQPTPVVAGQPPQMPAQPAMANPAMAAMPGPCFPDDGSAYAPIDTEGRAFMGPDPGPFQEHPDTVRLIMANHSVFLVPVLNNHPMSVVAGLDLPQVVVSMPSGRRCWVRGMPPAMADHYSVYVQPDDVSGNNSLTFLCVHASMERSFGRPTGRMIDGRIVGTFQITDWLVRPGQNIGPIDGTRCRALPNGEPTF